MDCLIAVLETRPLTVHLSLLNPHDADQAQLVPRTLNPLGLFFTLEVSDEHGAALFRSERPKQKPKLHPDRDSSYLSLEPGYSLGTVVSVDQGDFNPERGRYRLSVTYSNDIFTGPSTSPVGSIRCSCTRDVDLA